MYTICVLIGQHLVTLGDAPVVVGFVVLLIQCASALIGYQAVSRVPVVGTGYSAPMMLPVASVALVHLEISSAIRPIEA